MVEVPEMNAWFALLAVSLMKLLLGTALQCVKLVNIVTLSAFIA
jgi:hypothetical protein